MQSPQQAARLAVALDRKARRRTPLQSVIRFLKTRPLGSFGGALVIFMIVVALFAPTIATHDPYELRVDRLFLPPNQQNLFGTDNYGRDLFSRLVWGSRISVYVGFVSVAVGGILGALIGLACGYLGGRFDMIVQRFVDAKQAIPGLVLALAIMAALGASLTNVIIAISIGLVTSQARIVRSQALAVREMMYVEAARGIGCSDFRILFRHIMPNCIAPFLIVTSAQIGSAILTEAALSFLGLGVPTPNPSWGAMLSGAAQQYVERAPWMAIFPGLAITSVVFGFNLFGDALRDVLDPRLRRG